MRLLLLLAAPVLAFDMAKAPDVTPMKPVRLPPRVEWRLPNGLSVVLVEDHRLPMVTAALATTGGAASLSAEDAGLADALGELITDGTATKTSKQVAEAAELYGGSISGGSSPDAMYLESSALSDKAEAMLDLMSEIARKPAFPQSEVELRKANMKEELEANRAESDFLSGVAFNKKLFAGHPYAITAPTDRSIARIDRERVLGAYKKLFTPASAVLVLVGDIHEAAARRAIAAKFGAWKGGAPPPDVAPVPAPRAERTIYLLDRPKSSQVSFVLGNLAAREDNPSFFDLLVANGVLGGSFSSRLVRDIREDKGYTYSIGSGLSHRLTASAFKIRTPVRTEVTGQALSAILEHLKDLRKDGPKPEELKQAQNYIAGSFARGLETQDGVLEAVLHQKLMRLPRDYYDRYVERVMAVTPESAKRAAQTFIRPDELTIVAVGDAAQIKDVLAKFSTKPVVTVNQDGD